jgi:SAM-dependent methyltransferase
VGAALLHVVAFGGSGAGWRAFFGSVGRAAAGTSVLALWILLGLAARDGVEGSIVVQRNFYGRLRVTEYGSAADRDGYGVLYHGIVAHGAQWLHPDRTRELGTYYCETSGIGRALRRHRNDGPWHVGVVGLGIGTVAAYAEAGDTYRFYEINPLVPALAREYFTYLSDSKADVAIVLGDGRLSLERELPQGFDVLLVDAFNGDSIPVHLLSREAFEVYFRHLKPDGILAIHVSNRYLDLEPVVTAAAQALRKAARVVDEHEDTSVCFATAYVLLANREAVLEDAAFATARTPYLDSRVPAWTDDYSNLFYILR